MTPRPDAPLVMCERLVKMVALARAHGRHGREVHEDTQEHNLTDRAYAERVVPQATARERASYKGVTYRDGKWYRLSGESYASAAALIAGSSYIFEDDDHAALLALRDAPEPEDALDTLLRSMVLATKECSIDDITRAVRALIAAESPTRTAAEVPDGDWPAYLMIRDTKLNDDQGGQGQRIFTTAGSFYEKMKYVRADLVEAKKFTAADHVAALVEKIKSLPRFGMEVVSMPYDVQGCRKVRKPLGEFMCVRDIYDCISGIAPTPEGA